MGQNFPTFNEAAGGDSVKTGLLNQRTRTDSLQSNFSGSAFPADTGTVLGQSCYRTDQGKLYVLTGKTPDVWSEIPSGLPITVAEGGTGATTAAAARTNLGLGSAATRAIGTAASDVLEVSAADARYLNESSNLSDLDSVATARTNLDVYSKAEVDNLTGSTGEITGEVRMYCGTSAPTGWLLCDGTAHSRTTESALFGVLGTAYGAGDGSTTFNVPDFRMRAPMGVGQSNTAEGGGIGTNLARGQKVGAETHTLVTGEIPAHNHSLGYDPTAVRPTATGTSGPAGGTGTTGDTGGGNAHNNIGPGLGINFIIKK